MAPVNMFFTFTFVMATPLPCFLLWCCSSMKGISSITIFTPFFKPPGTSMIACLGMLSLGGWRCRRGATKQQPPSKTTNRSAADRCAMARELKTSRRFKALSGAKRNFTLLRHSLGQC